MQIQINKIKDLLLEILKVIEYPEDKKGTFVEDFMTASIVEAMSNFAEKLPEDKKNEMRSKAEFTPEELEALKQYFPPDAYTQEVERVSQEGLISFVKELKPALRDEQKQKLDEIMKSFNEAIANPVAPVTPEVIAPATSPVEPPQQ